MDYVNHDMVGLGARKQVGGTLGGIKGKVEGTVKGIKV